MRLDHREISIIKGMLARGDKQHDIAAYFGVNGGRVAEIKTGQTGADILPTDQGELPPAGPIMAGRSALHARDALKALRDRINETLDEIERFEVRGE